MADNKFEPKRKFRWIMEIPGIPAFLISNAQRPSYNIRRDSFGSYQIDIAPMKVEIFDTRQPNAARLVEELRERTGGELNSVVIKMLDEIGTVYEQWLLRDTFLTHIDYGQLSYGSEDSCSIHLEMCYNHFELQVLDGIDERDTWTVTIKRS